MMPPHATVAQADCQSEKVVPSRRSRLCWNVCIIPCCSAPLSMADMSSRQANPINPCVHYRWAVRPVYNMRGMQAS